MKCDETKPICGPCAKKERICDYATSERHRVDPAASDRPVPRTLPDLSTTQQAPTSQQINDPSENGPNPGPVHHEPQLNPGYTWAASEGETDPPPAPLLEYRSEDELTPGQTSETLHGDYLSPSTASLAAVRWLGLLAGGFPGDNLQQSTVSNVWESHNLALGHSENDDPPQVSSLQRATQVLDSPCGGAASLDVTNGHATEGSALTEMQIWQSREPIELSPAEQALFEHFVHHVSAWIDFFDPTNKFSTLVAHLALRNAGLLNAILALAFRHLAVQPGQDDPVIVNKPELALQYYYQTLHYVRRAMLYPTYKTSLELLSTALIISAYEMLDNSTNDWEHHLEGVFLIQRSQTIHGETGGLQSAVWWAWLCQDLWAAFREKRKTLTFWVPQKPLSVLLPHELANRSIYNAAKVISFCATTTTSENIQRQINEATLLRTTLEEWRRHLTVEFSPLPLGSRDASSCFQPVWIRPPEFGKSFTHSIESSMEICLSGRAAVAVQFFSVSYILLISHEPCLGGLERHLERQSAIRRCVENICGIGMTLKDNASSLMSSQALFIAGIHTQEIHFRGAILDLLEACRERCGWPVKSLGDELQQIWENQASL
ncbi:unnamed protein product [Penicillium salamii]|uniref:Zn(2)-C6 fungal-type domain-containing protein n=1 Tax=Penicillium salamii TaxID=1612424 RepID=A0A9W4J1M1_9EURO|nr:unnamed protein product [Penicillium salamii]